MRQNILSLLKRAAGRDDIVLTQTKERAHGDFAVNIAMQMAKELKKNPREVAADLKQKIEKEDVGKLFRKVEIAGPGFINLFVNDAAVIESFKAAFEKGGSFGRSDAGRGKKVILEFVSANPTGPLHIGHGRWAAIGDSLAAIMNAAGYSVHKEFYINNIGKQINMLIASVSAAMKGEPVPEGGYGGAYIKDIARTVNESAPSDMKAFVLENILAQQKETLALAGVEFDEWFPESRLHESGEVKAAVERLKRNGATYEKDGAVWFRSEEFGDDKDRVLVRENGEPTYFTADIAYHADKFRRGFGTLINVWGADHHGYVKRLQSALEAMKLPSQDLEILIGQLVTLFRGSEPVRMSKRTGEMITFREVIEEVGRDAVRFFLTMMSADSHMDFDLELAKKQTLDNPVYYVQYAHARICNIIKNSSLPVPKAGEADLGLLKEESERDLMVRLLDLPEETAAAAAALQPHHITRYAREVAALFHSYYHKCRVISEDAEMMKARLVLAETTRIVLSNVLKLLGVSVPERM